MGDEFPELGLLELLSHAQFRVTSRVAAALRERRSSLEEWRVLSLLADGEGHAMSEIAEFTLMLPPSTTKLIDRLVSTNLVYRRVDPTDRRRVLVFLSARGRAAHRRLRPVVDEVIAGMDDEPLRDHIRELLRRVGSQQKQT
jgi:MarR family transcriptional regulator, organic hydroperoxide resistance regulator